MSVDEDAQHKQVEKAMAYRVKYRLDSIKQKRKMPLESMGAHMTNRGLLNQYPNENDVRSLGLALIAGGFDYDEANHNGVGVEEVPPEVRASTKDPLTGHVYEGIGNYIERMTNSSDLLQTCFTKITARGVVVGSLSHTHLLL